MPVDGGVSEDVFSGVLCPQFMGYVDGRVRVVRVVQGARSGIHTILITYVYPTLIDQVVELRDISGADEGGGDGRVLEGPLDREVVKGDVVVKLEGKKMPAYHVQLSRRLLEGHTKSELEDAAGGEPPLDVYFSRDGEFIPLLLEAKLMFGTMRARLEKRCDVKDVCLLGINP
jgi:hypothetical protein